MYGLPHSVKEAVRIDAETGTAFWRKAIKKEMRNAMIAFDFPTISQNCFGPSCSLVLNLESLSASDRLTSV